MAWPLTQNRPGARLGAIAAVGLAMVGFSLGYWELLSGLALALFGVNPTAIRILFDAAVMGTPTAIAGLLIGVLVMLSAAGVPTSIVGPAMVAGYGVGWILDPYATMGSSRLAPLRQQYLAAPAALDAAQSGAAPHSVIAAPKHSSFWSSGGGDWGGGGGDDSGGGAVLILVLALGVLALAGGIITAILVFMAARKNAESKLRGFALTAATPGHSV